MRVFSKNHKQNWVRIAIGMGAFLFASCGEGLTQFSDGRVYGVVSESNGSGDGDSEGVVEELDQRIHTIDATVVATNDADPVPTGTPDQTPPLSENENVELAENSDENQESQEQNQQPSQEDSQDTVDGGSSDQGTDDGQADSDVTADNGSSDQGQTTDPSQDGSDPASEGEDSSQTDESIKTLVQAICKSKSNKIHIAGNGISDTSNMEIHPGDLIFVKLTGKDIDWTLNLNVQESDVNKFSGDNQVSVCVSLHGASNTFKLASAVNANLQVKKYGKPGSHAFSVEEKGAAKITLIQ